jgi:hypothetical protein
MFKHDLETIDKLRADAVNTLEAHVSGIRKITAYAAQLVWIGGKFPIDVSKFWTLDSWAYRKGIMTSSYQTLTMGYDRSGQTLLGILR